MGKRILSVGVNKHHGGSTGGRYTKKDPEGLIELCAHMHANEFLISEIDCKGKFMFWRFNPDWVMWCTYGMSGQWTTQKPDKHTSITMWTDGQDGQGLLAINFRDPRHFGTVKFVHDPNGTKTLKKLNSLGPDMLSDPPNEAKFRQALLRKHEKTLAEVLMDQSVVSGVGNYVKAESLYAAKLSPHRLVRDIATHEFESLRTAIIDVMQSSYKSGGATISTYRNPDGSKGEAQRRFVVYGNKTDLLGNEVIREETKDGRTTHWCPKVQR